MKFRQDYLTHPESVQVLYRPVVQLGDRLPDIPQAGDVTSPAALWWTEQYTRCRQGWTAPNGVWLNPIYYWYLNFVKIEYVDERTMTEIIDSPLYLDSDHEIINAIWFCLGASIPRALMEGAPKKKLTKKERLLVQHFEQEQQEAARRLNLLYEDLNATKGRRKHWSYLIFCAVLPWLFTVDPAGHLGAGFDEKSSREEGQRVFRGVYDRLHPFWKFESFSESKHFFTDKEMELVPAMFVPQEDGTRLVKEAPYGIYFRELDRRPGALRGKRYRFIILDEAGKYLNLKKVKGSLKDCLRVGTLKIGTLIMGGTFDMITVESDDYQKEWENAAAMGVNKLFVPAWKCAPPNVDYFTGRSYEPGARAAYMAERQQYLDAGDMEGYAFCVQESPLDEWELFSAPTQSHYPPHLLIEQTQKIAELKATERVIRGRMAYATNELGGLTDVVEFIPDPNGHCWMHPDVQPHPGIQDLDILGVDDVYKDVAPHSESLCAIVAYRRFDHRLPGSSDMFTAYYEFRPAMDDFAQEVIMWIKYWNQGDTKTCRVVIEANAKYTADKVIDAGLGDNLIWYGADPGLRNSDPTIIAQTGLALSFIKRKMKLLRFQRIVDGFKKWRQGNDDVSSATHLALMGVSTIEASLTPEESVAGTVAKGDPLFQRQRLKEKLAQTQQNMPLAGRIGTLYQRAAQVRARHTANRQRR